VGGLSHRLRSEARDLWELVLLPGLAALMPWTIAFRVLRRLALLCAPYADATRVARTQAAARGWLGDSAHWLLVRRLVTLVDHADLYLARTRSDAWMLRNMDVQGEWPQGGTPGLICTFHWGAGMWGLRHARACGLKAHALVAPLQGAHFAGRRVLLGYARARTAEVARALGCATLDTSASLRPVLKALRDGDQVLAAIDVPSDQVSASEEIDLLGMRARVPRGLLRLAVDQQVPVTVYLTGLTVETGRRFLRIHQLGVHSDLEALMTQVFGLLDAAIREDPPAWHFWSEAERFFVRR
jgi:phosphatidylinositol dimannoside acyltransferase